MATTTGVDATRMEEKVKEIEQILGNPDGIDLWKLREACLSEGGLVHDSLRRRVWPLLVGLPSAVPPHQPLGTSTRTLFSSTRTLGASDDDEEETLRSVNDADELAPLPATTTTTTTPAADVSLSTAHTGEEASVADSATTISRTNARRSSARVPKCQDHYQIDLDVARCTWHLLTGDQRAQRYQMEHKRNRQVARIIRRKQRRLGLFINLTLVQSEEEHLRYYQGYHDVACIFLTTLVSGSTPGQGMHAPHVATPPALELPARVLNQVSQSHLRDYLKDNFVDLQTALRLTIFPLLATLDPNVHDHLYAAEMEPFFCLSWVITWFAHEVRDSALVKRLFDAFLVGHPLLPLYVSVAMVLHPINRQIILETEPDFAILHQTLRGLPRNSSMVGWKYRPGDGYVSDDEDDDDDDDDDDEVAAGEARLDAAVDGDIHQLRSVLDRDGVPGAPTGATSSVSTGSTTQANASESHARVPFQELMELAIRFMQAVPPRHLLSIARRYYGRAHVRALLEETNSIQLLGDVPSWAIQPTLSTETPRTLVQRILRAKRQTKAALALGLGLSDIDRRRRRRIRFWVGVVAVALFAVAVTWSDQGVFQRMQNVLGWSDDSSDGTCQIDTDTPKTSPQEPLSVPRVGSAVRHSLSVAEATVSYEGNTEPVVVHPKAFVSIHDLPPPPARRPVTQPMQNAQPGRSSSRNDKGGSSWFNAPVMQWLRTVSVQERMEKHVERLSKQVFGQVERLLFSLKHTNSRPMITDGKKARVARRLKPLRNFLSKPLDEFLYEGKKIVWDQGKIMQRWLNNPHCFTEKCASGKGKSRF